MSIIERHYGRMNEPQKYQVAVVARLYDGTQLVRERHLQDGAPEVIQTFEGAGPRLEEYEVEFDKDRHSRPVGFSIWERESWGSASVMDLHEWHMMTPDQPPASAVVPVKDHEPVVAIRYVDYQLKGGRIG